MESQKSKQPKLGDIVYYRIQSDSKRGEFRPAIVTRIDSEDEISLCVFDLSDDPSGYTRVCSSISYSKTEFGHWFWTDDLENPSS